METCKNYKYIELRYESINSEIINDIPENYARKHCLICFKNYSNKLCVAIKECNDINMIIEELKFITEKDIEIFYSTEKDIDDAIDTYYHNYTSEKIINIINKQNTNESVYEHIQESNIDESPAVKLVDSIISSAIYKKASDIHIEPFKEYVTLRYRVDGSLFKVSELPYSIYQSLCVRIKIITRMDITEKRIAQDGSIVYKLNKTEYDLRVSTLPTVYGEKIVIRILYKSEAFNNLNSLGFRNEGLKTIRNMLKSSHGIILITGPTGSGKTTTLYAMLNEINDIEKNIITIENPVEYMINGINQVNVNYKAGITFASGLRSILRQDPDVIMIGEIRDEETAQIAVRAAITGHLVLATLHTNDSSGAIARLFDMGVPKYLIADSVVGIIAQRLIRKLCNNCKMPNIQNEKSSPGKYNNKFDKGNGCEKCNFIGYSGRSVMYEILNMDSEIRKMIYSNCSSNQIQEYYFNGSNPTLLQYGLSIVNEGITTYEELSKIAYLNQQ